eukprot:SAG11_NODE_1335_length_5174_cov_4.761773_3_plen_140_part_00
MRGDEARSDLAAHEPRRREQRVWVVYRVRVEKRRVSAELQPGGRTVAGMWEQGRESGRQAQGKTAVCDRKHGAFQLQAIDDWFHEVGRLLLSCRGRAELSRGGADGQAGTPVMRRRLKCAIVSGRVAPPPPPPASRGRC